MKYLNIPNTDLKASNVVMGCLHICELSNEDAGKVIHTALDEGVNFFDHADVYGGGECESIFAQALPLTDDIREKLIIQSKCGIIKSNRGYYEYFDFSKDHIIRSVEGSLKRLKTDYLDVLLLHRPDTLMRPQEVGEAFDILASKGMVKYFGVSNFNPMLSELVQSSLKQKIIFNQMQFSLVHTLMIDTGLTVNMKIDQSIDRDGSTLEYSRLKDVTIQAWSPFQKGFFDGPFLTDGARYTYLNSVIKDLAKKYGVTDTAIAVAWITYHPADMLVITGTTNPKRMKDCCAGSDIPFTKDEWYHLYAAAGNMMP